MKKRIECFVMEISKVFLYSLAYPVDKTAGSDFLFSPNLLLGYGKSPNGWKISHVRSLQCSLPNFFGGIFTLLLHGYGNPVYNAFRSSWLQRVLS